MILEVLTKDDLSRFKQELVLEMKDILASQGNAKKWVRSSELKELFNISTSKMQTMRINGTLPYSKFGATIYYDIEAIEAVLKTNQRNTRL